MKNKSKTPALIWIFVLGFVYMLVYVWLRVESQLLSSELQELKTKETRLIMENERSKAEVARLSSFERIQKIAQEKLGLVFPPPEDIIEIAKD